VVEDVKKNDRKAKNIQNKNHFEKLFLSLHQKLSPLDEKR
jgi:hypothetical protein